jgi:hypothetical protein
MDFQECSSFLAVEQWLKFALMGNLGRFWPHLGGKMIAVVVGRTFHLNASFSGK